MTGPTRTPDGRHVVVDGRRWRASDPGLPEDLRQALVDELMTARREVGAGRRTGDDERVRAARLRVQDAKVALGERGHPWWDPLDDAALAARLDALDAALRRARGGADVPVADLARALGRDAADVARLAPMPLDLYAAAAVTIARPDGSRVVVTGTEVATDRAKVATMDVPRGWLDAAAVEVVTAWNPWSRPAEPAANAAANERLRSRLVGLVGDSSVLHAVGSSPDDSWSEPGFAVLDAPPELVRTLANEHGQHAIYRWDADGWWIVPTQSVRGPVLVAASVRTEPARPADPLGPSAP